MLNILKTKIGFAKKNTVFFTVLISVFSYAATAVAAGNDAVSAGLNDSGFKSLFGGGLAQSQDVSKLIQSIIFLMLFFAGAIAVVFLIIGGYWYITSAGNEEQAEKGRKSIINAIIGIVIVVLAYTIVSVVVNTVTGGVSSSY